MVDDEVTGTDWSGVELDLIVADYFSMLRAEMAGQMPNKTEHRRLLMAHVHRSNGSIEFKHQNISAALEELGLPHISGYKPRRNFQGALFEAIGKFLAENPDPVPFALPLAHGFADPSSLYEEPPPTPGRRRLRQPDELVRLIRKFDPALRDQLNRALGEAGEQHVYDYEQRKLFDADRKDLSKKVRWVSKVDGDGAGYDIRSFDLSGAERLIEVKTTRGGSTTPFYLTRNENALASQRVDAFRLFRLYDFSKKPRLFTLTPPLDQLLQLEPMTFRASLK